MLKNKPIKRQRISTNHLPKYHPSLEPIMKLLDDEINKIYTDHEEEIEADEDLLGQSEVDEESEEDGGGDSDGMEL
jgi:hypothetical protein